MDTILKDNQTIKAERLALIRANVPAELQERDQWLVWKYVLRPGEKKPTKVPYNPVKYSKADTTDSDSWGTFEQACTAFLEQDYDGIGYVFSKDDPYTGADFDNCVTNGQIEPKKWSYICELDSYSEYSPSGTGIHTLVRAMLPAGGRKSIEHRIEMYDQARFFTVTGQHVPGTPTVIENRQEELSELHREIFGKKQKEKDFSKKPNKEDRQAPIGPRNIPADDNELIERMFRSKRGEAIRLLWEGDISAYNGDDSSADLALCNHLAFWTGKDPERMDRLFRQSGLMRDKWEREDYRERTIEKALEDLPQPPEQRQFIFLPYDTFMVRPPKQWKIRDIAGERDIVTFFGMAGSGKTFVIIDLIYAACQGKDWVGRWDSAKQWSGKFVVDRPLTVAYCFGEGGAGLPSRFRAAEQYYGKPLASVFFVEDVPQLYKSREPSGIDAFIRDYKAAQAAGEVPPLDLLIIDTQTTATLGADENSSTDMAEVIANAQKAVKMLCCSVILIHHATKAGDTYRGSSVLHGAMDCMVEVEKKSNNDFCIKCFKLKDGEPWEPQRFSLVSHSGIDSPYAAWDGSLPAIIKLRAQQRKNIDTIRQLLLDNPGRRFTTTEMEKQSGIAAATAKRTFEMLERENFATYECEQRRTKKISTWYFDPVKSKRS